MGTETEQSRDEGTVVGALTLVARDLTRLFGSVQEVDWNRPTPCSEWTLRDLTEHITGGNRFTIRILSGDTSEDAMTAAIRSFAEDHDTRRSLVTSTFELENRFLVPGTLGQTCHHLNGDLSADDVLRLRLHDLIIHTWDAAQALQATPFEIHPELVSWALADITADTFAARHFDLDRQVPRGERRDQDALLSAFGRRAPRPT